MQEYKSSQLIEDGNAFIDIAILSVIGDRENQQDSFGYSLKDGEVLAIVCDGMGGHEGGQIASGLAVKQFLMDYETHYPSDDPLRQMVESLRTSDSIISNLKSEDGSRMNAGSTCVSIVIKGKELHWCSVGDSRAYLLRGEEFVQFTQDQNYGTVLSEQLHAGLISEEQYEKESVHGDALISYLGIGEVSLIDYNKSPLMLESGDRIAIMTDGLYKYVDVPEIQQIIDIFRVNSEALQELDIRARKNARNNGLSRDNMTVAIISIK